MAYRCSFRVTEAVYLVERMVDALAARARDGPGRAAAEELHPPRAVPLHRPRRAGSTTPATTSGRCARRWTSPATTSCAASRPRSARAASSWASASRSSPRPSAPGPRKDMDILGLGMADGAELRVHPTGKAVLRHLASKTPGPGPRDDVRPDRRRGARHPARGHRGRPRRHRPDAVRARHLRQPLDAGVGRGDGARRAQGARRARLIAAGDARGVARRPRVGAAAAGSSRATREQGKTIQEIAHGRARRGRAARGRRGRAWTPSRVYNPPNLTFPFGAYICVVDVDPGHRRGQGAPLHRGRRLRRRGSTR